MPAMCLDESARVLGHLRWVEQRLFETLGGWVQSTPEPDAKLLFARHSYHHAWHADLLARCLPGTSHHDPDELTAPAGESWIGAYDALRGLAAIPARVVAVYGVVVPAVIGVYEVYLADASPVRDAAGIRWVRAVLGDERADLAEAGPLLRANASDPAAADGHALEVPPSR